MSKLFSLYFTQNVFFEDVLLFMYFLILMNDVPIRESWKSLSYPSPIIFKYH